MKYTLRLAALFLAVMLLISAAACQKTDANTAVMTLGEQSIDEGMYRFLFSTYKARYLSMYKEAKDTDSFWRGEHSPGVTNAAWMDSLIRDSIRMLMTAQKLFADANLSLSEGTEEKIDSYIDDMITERCSGSRKDFEAQLAEYGANIQALREMLLSEEKMSQLYTHYYGENGTRSVSNEECDAFYRENYVRFIQLNVNDAYAYVEQDGAYVQDKNGKYKTRALTDSERAEKECVLTEIDANLTAGAPLEELYEKFSENKDYPGGYYFSHATAGNYDETLVAAAFALEEGAQTKLHTEHGTFYIKRMPLDDGGYALTANADFFGDFDSSVKNALYDELLKSQFDLIKNDAGKEDAISVTNVKPNFDLY